MVFVSTVIPGFSLLEINYKEVYFLLDMYKFSKLALLFDEGGVGLSMYRQLVLLIASPHGRVENFSSIIAVFSCCPGNILVSAVVT
jgi:hypothetical protein